MEAPLMYADALLVSWFAAKMSLPSQIDGKEAGTPEGTCHSDQTYLCADLVWVEEARARGRGEGW